MFYVHQYKQSGELKCVSGTEDYEVLYHNCIYIRFPEDEPLGSKHVEDIKIKKYINLKKCAFSWFISYNNIKMYVSKKNVKFVIMKVNW